MRPIVGWSVFILGLLVLGVWARFDHAPAIEANLSEKAENILEDNGSISTSVSGRDIIVTGLAESEEDKERILAEVQGIPGLREIRDAIEVGPPQEPPSLKLLKDDPALIADAGVLASIDLSGIEAMDPGVRITLLNQKTDPVWVETARLALSSMDYAVTGSADIIGSSVRVSARVNTESDAAMLRTHIDQAPPGYDWKVTIEVLRPKLSSFTFAASKNGTSWIAHGVLGSEKDERELRARLAGLAEPEIRLASNAPAGWMKMLGRGIDSLDQLDFGQLEIKGRDIHLAGLASSEDIANEINARFASLPPLYSATVEIRTLPVAMTALTNPQSKLEMSDAIATPSELSLPRREDIASKTVTITKPTAPTLQTNSAPRPQTNSAPKPQSPVFGPVEPGAMFSIRYNVTKGIFVGGTAPSGVTTDSLKEALNLPSLVGSLTPSNASPVDNLEWRLAKFAPYLRYFDRFELRQEADRIILSGTILPNFDAGLLQSDMDKTVPGPDFAQVRAPDRIPSEGYLRLNRITGNLEVFRGDAWQISKLGEQKVASLTNVAPVDALTQCQNSTRAVLSRYRIEFEPGSAQLLDRSNRALDNIADVVVRCFSTDSRLVVEIEGQNDATGEVSENLFLAADRAESVVEALVIRGVLADRIVVRDLGETLATNDNNTDDGRLRNTQAVVHWTQR